MQLVNRYHQSTHLPMSAFKIRLGEWYALFDSGYLKMMLAACLNSCLPEPDKEQSPLIGYLFTTSSLYLVYSLDEPATRKQLMVFREKLSLALKREIEHFKQRELNEYQKSILMKVDLFPNKLFEQIKLMDAVLIRLLTGKRGEQLYTDYREIKLNELVNKSKFCSVIDYSGAVGPVYIQLIK